MGEQMRIWKVQCRRIRTTAGDKISLEGSKWLKKYLVRMGMQPKPVAKDKKSKKSKKSKKKVNKDQLAAITKGMKNVKVKKGTKDKKKGAQKLNQNKKGKNSKKLEKKLKEKQSQNKKEKRDGLAAITKGMKNVKVKTNKKKKKKGVKRT